MFVDFKLAMKTDMIIPLFQIPLVLTKHRLKRFPFKGCYGTEGGYRYSSTLFKTLALTIGVGGQHHTPAALPPGKTRYPLYRRLGGPRDRSGRVRKISPPPTGIRSPDRPARSESLYRLSYPGCRLPNET